MVTIPLALGTPEGPLHSVIHAALPPARTFYHTKPRPGAKGAGTAKRMARQV